MLMEEDHELPEQHREDHDQYDGSGPLSRDEIALTADDTEDDELNVEFGTLAAQKDESYYDSRLDANDDLEKGRIKYPKDRLYGRDTELKLLHQIFEEMTGNNNPNSSPTNNNSSANGDNSNLNNASARLRTVFLGGYSGTGKSALIQEFVRQLNHGKNKGSRSNSISSKTQQQRPLYWKGKFEHGRHNAQPFSAVSQALNQGFQAWLQHQRAKLKSSNKIALAAAASNVNNLSKKTNSTPLENLRKRWRRMAFLASRDAPEAALLQATFLSSALEEYWDACLEADQQKNMLLNQSNNNNSVKENNIENNAKENKSSTEEETELESSSSTKSGGAEEKKNNNNKSTGKMKPASVSRISTHSTSSGGGGGITSSRSNLSSGRRNGKKASALEQDSNQIKHALINFVKGIATSERPLILFIDDLQWADDASLQVLRALLEDKTVHHVLFVGSYRSDEVCLTNENATTATTNNSSTIPEETEEEEGEEKEEEKTAPIEEHPLRDWKFAIQKSLEPDRQEPQKEDAEAEEKRVNEALQNLQQAFCYDIEISNLSPDNVGEFIADALDRSPPDVLGITQAVYGKTLGNIFYVQQALDELVRKNAIYYDVMTFGWQVAREITDDMLHDYLSANVVEMVQSKLQTLPGILQQALAVAAYTRQTFDTSLLVPLLSKSDSSSSSPRKIGMRGSCNATILNKLFRRAIDEGLIMQAALTPNFEDSSRSLDIGGGGSHEFRGSNSRNSKRSSNTRGSRLLKRGGNSAPNLGDDDGDESFLTYQFAHDKIREAACASIPEGEKRNQFIWSVATALVELHSQLYCSKNTDAMDEEDMMDNEEDEWMLFTAAGHFNSIPPSMTDAREMSMLNLSVGKIAISKGAFHDGLVFFKHGVARLDPATCWDAKGHPEEYSLTLELYNLLLECQFSLGLLEGANEAVQQVMTNAATLLDKIRAQYVSVYMASGKNNEKYNDGVKAGLEALELYGMDNLPLEPTDRNIRREKFQLRLALRGRPLSCLSTFPEYDGSELFEDDESNHDLLMVVSIIRIAEITVHQAMVGGSTKVVEMVANRILRLAVTKKVITKDIPIILTSLSGPLRQQGKFEKAISFANVCQGVIDRFPHEKSGQFQLTRLVLYGGLITLRIPFRDSIEPFLDIHKGLMAAGMTDPGMGAAMHAMFTFLIGSLPLGSLFEPKILLFEQMCDDLGKKTFIAVFQILRQTLYNLQGGRKSSLNPTEFAGEAFNEEATLAQFEGGAVKMTQRDCGIFRLMLAVTFNDEKAMMEMLERLDPYPVFDRPLDRQHLRLSYVAFASLILLQKDKDNAFLKKWANEGIEFYQKLARFGSPNAQPVFSCLKTLQSPSLAAFDESIQFVSNLGLLNLAGIMNERCGLWLRDLPKNADKTKPRFNERCSPLRLDSQHQQSSDFGTDGTSYEDYLKCAMWCFHDWGATGKCASMQDEFPFLRNAFHEKPPSQLSSVRRHAAMLGVPRPGPLSASSA